MRSLNKDGKLVRSWWAGLLLLCVLVGAFLRFHHLERKSLWADELFTLSMAYHHSLWPEQGRPFFERKTIFDLDYHDTFLTAKAAEQSPPLNDLAEKWTVSLWGVNEWSARLPAAVSAVVLLCWFGLFAWRHPDPEVRRTLAWATLLIAFSPILVIYAKDGRAYSMGVSLVGMAGLLWMLRWRHGPARWQGPSWLECLFWLLACYTHYNAALIPILLLGMDAWQATRTRSLSTWKKLLTVAALFSVWLWLNIHTILFTSKGGVSWNLSQQGSFIENIVTGGLVLLDPNLLLLFSVVFLWVVVYYFFRPEEGILKKSKKHLIFLLFFCLVYMGLVEIIVARAGMKHPRYFIFMLPYAFTAMAMVLSQIRKKWMAMAVVLAVVVVSIPAHEYGRKTKIEDFRDASKLALEGFDSETAILYPWVPNERIYRIYLENMAGGIVRSRMIGVSVKEDVPEVCAKLDGFNHVAVIAHITARPVIDETYHYCQGKWPQREHISLHNIYVEHWRKY